MIAKFLEIDLRLSQSLRMDHGGSRWWKTMAFLAHSGDSWFWVFGLGLFWLLFPAWRWLSAFAIFSIVVVVAAVMALKFTIRRRRPPGTWDAVYRSTDPHSFPSGHAARTVLLTIFAFQFLPVPTAAAVLVWTVLVCFSRVATGMHYLSDVLAGVILGLLSAAGLLALQPWLAVTLPYFFHPLA